jgi:uncharacterized membrane protein
MVTEPAEKFIGNSLQQKLRLQAWRVWLATVGGVGLWLGVIVIAPLMQANGISQFSSPIYHFFSYICHQIPERSLHIDGHPMAVCSRCFGVYFGLLVGIVVYPLMRPIDETEPVARIWLFLSLIPITVDWSLTIFGIWENTHVSRFVTGMILGVSCAIFIVPALVEVVRNLTTKRLRTQ